MAYSNPEDQRAYAKHHYQQNKAAYIARARAHSDRTRKLAREIVRELKNVPCADCRRLFPHYVMDFDHIVGNKHFNVGDALRRGFSLKRILAEIEKCVVVCANCHRERTYGAG